MDEINTNEENFAGASMVDDVEICIEMNFNMKCQWNTVGTYYIPKRKVAKIL